MMATAYATSEELAMWLNEDTPANAAWLLDRATELIDSVATAPFNVDLTTGLPVDAGVAATLRDATCAQVRFWLEVGYENDVDGLAGTAVTVGGSGGYQGKRAPERSPQALRIMRNAGLLTTGPQSTAGVEGWPR